MMTGTATLKIETKTSQVIRREADTAVTQSVATTRRGETASMTTPQMDDLCQLIAPPRSGAWTALPIPLMRSTAQSLEAQVGNVAIQGAEGFSFHQP